MFSNPTHPQIQYGCCEPVSEEVADDVLRAEKAGNDAKNTFIDQRLLTTAIDFFDSIKK